MYDTISTYQGWTNRETWLVSLWLNNDEDSYGFLLEAYKQAGSLRLKAEWLKDQLSDEAFGQIDSACLWQDLLLTAVDRVNWLEVLENNG